MANREVNISDFLGKKNDESDGAIVDPNLTRISYTPAPKTDIGSLGLKEPEPEAAIKSDKEVGLDLIDKMIERKRDEVARFNKALEENGGELDAEEWAKMNGESGALEYIAENPSKGTIAEMRKQKQLESEEEKESVANEPMITITADDELAQLEAEAASFDSAELPQKNNDTPVMQKAPVAKTLLAAPTMDTDVDIDKTINDIENELKALDGIETENSDKPLSFNDKLKAEIEKRIIDTSNIPISSFAIDTDHPITADSAIEQSHVIQPSFKWVLYHTGVPFTMRPYNTNEIDTLSELSTSSNNNPSNIRKIYELIYSHIEEGKGENFESWCRGVSNLDIQHLWMGVYGACFQFSNFIPYECDKCKEIVIPDTIPIMSMVKYKNEEAKTRFDSIMSMAESDPEYSRIRAHVIKAINSRIAVRIKIPTMYESIVEPAMLDTAFTTKYQDIINLIQSIEEMYFIDNGRLRKIAYKVDMNNPVKTLKFKILTWAKIIYTLNSDERGILYSIITSVAKDSRVGDVTYVEPAVVCDKCGAEISESQTTPSGLVFTRHQLATFGALQ